METEPRDDAVHERSRYIRLPPGIWPPGVIWGGVPGGRYAPERTMTLPEEGRKGVLSAGPTRVMVKVPRAPQQ